MEDCVHIGHAENMKEREADSNVIQEKLNWWKDSEQCQETLLPSDIDR